MEAVSVQGSPALAIPEATAQPRDDGKKAVRIVYGVDGTIVAGAGSDRRGKWTPGMHCSSRSTIRERRTV